MYTTAMNDYLMKGYAEHVEVDGPTTDNKQWYIPHHAVTHPNKPDKVPVVFDCAAKCRGVSLNQQLLKGPDLNTSLVGVLLRFRLRSVAVVADIEAMFHQLKVSPKEQGLFTVLLVA